jgi:hypothetical protein
MGYPAKVQAIKRGKGLQWVIYIPAAIAGALNIMKSETFEWNIGDKNSLILKRKKVRPVNKI